MRAASFASDATRRSRRAQAKRQGHPHIFSKWKKNLLVQLNRNNHYTIAAALDIALLCSQKSDL